MLIRFNKLDKRYLKQKVLFTIITTIITVLVTYKSLFYPINFESTLYNFNSESDNHNKPLVLLESVPKTFEASISKIDENKLADMNFSSTREKEKIKGLEMKFIENNFILEINGRTIYKTYLENYETITIKYKSSDNSFKFIKNNVFLDSKKLEINETPSFTGFHLQTNNVLFESTLETKNWKRNFGQDRYVLFLLLLALIIIFIYMQDLKVRKLKLSRITLGDTIVVLSLGASGYISPPGFDDGEILSIIRNLHNFGFATSFSSGYPLGQWWFELNSYWFTPFDQIFLLRLPNLIMYLTSWFLLDRFVIKKTVRESKYLSINLANSLIFLVFSLAWAGTLRYDPPVILILVLSIICVLNFIRERELVYLFYIGILISISLSTSISGLIMIPFGVYFVYSILRNIKIKNTFDIYHIILLNIGFFSWLFFFNSNLRTWFVDLKATFEVGDHSSLFLNEIERYQWIFQIWGSAARLSVVVTVATIILTLFSIWRKRSNLKFKEMEFISLILISFLGLFLTPSKFGWHFQVYLPLTLVLSSFLLDSFKQSGISLKKLSPIIALMLIPVVSGINVFGFTMTETYRTSGPINYFEKYLYFDKLSLYSKGLLIYIILLITIFLTSRLLEIRKNRLFTVVVFSLILTIVSPSIVYPILDAKGSSNWNFTKQSIYGTFSQADACGIENSTIVISGLKQLQRDTNLKFAFDKPIYPRIEIDNPMIRENVDISKTFYYSLPNGLSKVVFWLSGVTTPQEGSILVSLFDGMELVKKTSVEANGKVFGDDWQLFEIDTSYSTSLKIEFLQRKDQISDWRIIHPGVPTYSKLNESFNNPIHSIGSYWANYLFFPCANLGIKNNGVKMVPEYQFGSIVSMRNESIYNAESELIPVGCLEMLNTQAKSLNCFYRVVYEGNQEWLPIANKTY